MTALSPTVNQTTPATTAEAKPTLVVVPSVDVLEDPTGITLIADLPGVPRENLSIQVEGESLTIEAQVDLGRPEDFVPKLEEARGTILRREFTLSRELDTEHIQAELRDGVLTLRIPKVAEAQPRRIEVQVA
jgi:HSP20 family molecular chaperone IbpA